MNDVTEHRIKESLVYHFPNIINYVTSPLRSIAIELTNICQLHCEMCYATRKPKGFIDESLFKSIVNQIPSSVREVALGLSGENLLHGEFDVFLDYLRSHHPKVRIGMNTNGMLIEKYLDAIQQLDTITVSLDGFKETNDSQRKGADYDVIHDGIMSILSLPKHPFVRLNMVVTDKNKHETKEYLEYWMPKVDEVNFSLCFDEEGIYAKGNLWEPTSTNRLFCHEPFGYMAVTWNGIVTACCHDLNTHNIMGNLRDQTLKDVWNGPKFKNLRLACARHQHQNFPQCQNCEIWKFSPIKTYGRYMSGC